MDDEKKKNTEGKPAGEPGNIHFGDHAQVHGDVFSGGKRVVNSGGPHVEGDMQVGGDYVGGNKTTSQQAGGDIVGRDKITTTITQGLSGDQAQKLAEAFAAIQQKVDARPADPNVDKDEIKQAVGNVQQEVQKGEDANPNKVERWLTNLGNMAPDILKVTAATLANPAAGIATAIQLIAKKAAEGGTQ